ncbi:trace amine-associated receptor 13c-like [Dunckerocampus dactyliophorus]|uniref:trace amine-associated receptor 13c-like n=1 Tax=Dunckerocampus dactyliophorus TaxID=161453 RepID=UPI002404EEAB|nr:trace amine-associated receptor 13c-like [Dunckerocampus dactyliophorus]
MMEKEDQLEFCFPQLINISCRKPTSHWSDGVFLSVLLGIISIFTVVLNLLVIISISHFRQVHTPTNLLLLSLAVSDFLVGLLVWPGEIYMRTSCWTLGDVFSFLWFYMTVTLTSASVGNMVLISADRYVAICDPLHYNTKVTVRRVQLCVCLCWFFALLLCSIILKDGLTHLGKSNSCYGECVIGIGFEGRIIDLVMVFILPLSIIITLYMRVFVVAVSQARAMSSHVTSVTLQHSVFVRVKTSELKAARTLGILVLVFLMCLCPIYSVSLAGDNKIISSFAKYAIYLFYLNSCLNPLIYALFYPWFRRAVRRVVTLHILQPGSYGDNIL